MCQAVLDRRFPRTVKFADVRNRYDYPAVDLLCGGFPCQSVSMSGMRQGAEDERWLWGYFARVIKRLQPKWVVIENVEGIRTNGLHEVLQSLAGCGYDAEWDRIPASSVGAPHIRFRYFIVAYPTDRAVKAKGKTVRSAENPTDAESGGRDENPRIFRKPESRAYALYEGSRYGTDAYALEQRMAGLRPRNSLGEAVSEKSFARFGSWAVEPGMVRMVHGLSNRVDRIAGLGNAVVPQVAEWVGRRIMAEEKRLA